MNKAKFSVRRTIESVVKNSERQSVEIVAVPHRITESISRPEFPATHTDDNIIISNEAANNNNTVQTHSGPTSTTSRAKRTRGLIVKSS